MRPIDADEMMMRVNGHGTNKYGILHDVDIRAFINEQPTIDALPVVRCGECKHKRKQKNGQKYCGLHGSHYAMTITDDWFCADGERKDGEHE